MTHTCVMFVYSMFWVLGYFGYSVLGVGQLENVVC